MEYRQLGRTNLTVSTVSFGAWAIGGAWGQVDDTASMAALQAAVDSGVNFIDTADVYGDGRSERIVGRVIAGLGDKRPFVATKMLILGPSLGPTAHGASKLIRPSAPVRNS